MNSVPQDDDLAAFGTNAQRAESIFQGRLAQSHKKKSNKIYWIIGAVLLSIYFYTIYFYQSKIDTIANVKGGTSSEVVNQLGSKITQLENIEQANIKRIFDLEEKLKWHMDKESKEREAMMRNIANNPAASAPLQKIPKPTPAHYQPDKRPGIAPPYITPQLEAISERRSQKPGLVPITPGDKSLIQYLIQNREGKTIDQVIYSTDQQRAQRIQFHNQRIKYLNDKPQFQSLHLAKYNLKIDLTHNEQQKRQQSEEYAKVEAVFKLKDVTQEIPMCIVVPGYNNNARFRLQYNLNSIFTQNYTNYFVVLMNDASTDGSDELFRKYLQFYNVKKENYVYVENYKRRTALENIYMATHYYCSEDSVVVNMDGDDEFIGKNVLKVFNAAYQRHKAGVVYSNFYWFEQGVNIMLGFTSEYTLSEREGNNYRHAPQRFSHLRSFRAELFRKIDAKDFQDNEGKFFTIAYDMAIYFPVMELSCGRIAKIEGFHYLYNINTGLNDYTVDRNKQLAVDNKVRSSKKYTCDVEFDDRMKKG